MNRDKPVLITLNVMWGTVFVIGAWLVTIGLNVRSDSTLITDDNLKLSALGLAWAIGSTGVGISALAAAQIFTSWDSFRLHRKLDKLLLTSDKKPADGRAQNKKPSGSDTTKQSTPFLRGRIPILILGVALLVAGGLALGVSSELGFTIIGWGGEVILVYVVIDVLLLQQDRANWKVVEVKAKEGIDTELRGIFADVLLFSGAEDIVVTFPPDATPAEEERFIVGEQLKEAHRLAANFGALKEGGLPNIKNVTDLFDSRADNLASFQNRYWSRLLEPHLMAYLIELEAKLRRVQTSLDILRKYEGFPPPKDELGLKMRQFEISSTQEALYQDFQGLLAFVLEGIDSGIIPKE